VTIAFVEDDADDRFFICSALQEILPEADISAFSSATEFIHLLESGKVRPNVIVTDLRMPVMNGFDVLKRVSEDNVLHRIPVAVLSTSDNEDDVEKAMQMGAIGYYVKPVALEEYKAIFKKILETCDKPFLSFIKWLRGHDPLQDSPALA